jgi:hypothetical protein
VAVQIARVAWELPAKGAELCSLESSDSGFLLTGPAILAADGAPYFIEYSLGVDPEWRTARWT